MSSNSFQYEVGYASSKSSVTDPLSRLLQINSEIKTKNDIYKKKLVMFVKMLSPEAIKIHEVLQFISCYLVLSIICDYIRFNKRIVIKPGSFSHDELDTAMIC